MISSQRTLRFDTRNSYSSHRNIVTITEKRWAPQTTLKHTCCPPAYVHARTSMHTGTELVIKFKGGCTPVTIKEPNTVHLLLPIIIN